MNKVVTFLLTQNPEATTSFYRDTLGLTYLHDDGYALVFDMKGIQLRISKVPQFTPAKHTVLGWETDDITLEIASLVKKGVAFEHYPNMGQDEQGICTFPGGSKVAWFKDPDGNVLSISQHEAKAG
jgi:catechol 2,3-dioxygenase-like lactoylglutathione lyase family enzyme